MCVPDTPLDCPHAQRGTPSAADRPDNWACEACRCWHPSPSCPAYNAAWIPANFAWGITAAPAPTTAFHFWTEPDHRQRPALLSALGAHWHPESAPAAKSRKTQQLPPSIGQCPAGSQALARFAESAHPTRPSQPARICAYCGRGCNSPARSTAPALRPEVLRPDLPHQGKHRETAGSSPARC